MKNNILLKTVFSIFVVLGLTGCISSGIPAPKSDSDTLVAVPVLVLNGLKSNYSGEIKFTVSMDNVETGERESFVLSTKNNGYVYIKRFPAGKYRIMEYKTEGFVEDKKYSLNFNKDLVVKEGKLSIFPGKMTVFIASNSLTRRTTYLNYNMQEIDDDQINRIKEFLQGDESYHLWKQSAL